MEEVNVNDTVSQYTEEEKKQKYGFVTYSAREVQDHKGTETKFVVEDIITPGLNILAGPSKCGKSWWCLNIALSITQGEKFWGRNVTKGGVLYMALEDNDDRLRDRLNRLLDYGDAPEELEFTYDVGSIKAIEKGLPVYIEEHKDTKLIIIDVLQKVRGDISSNQTEYGYDYKEIGALKTLANKLDTSILLVTHTRKTPDKKNRMNEISGGVGVPGAADTLLLLSGEQEMGKPKTFYVKGRDVAEQSIRASFNSETCVWDYIGTEEEIRSQEAGKKYAASPMVKTVKSLIAKNAGRWQGTCTDLLQYGREETGSPIAKSSSALGRMFREFDPLFANDSIVHIHPNKNGGVAGRLHEFYIVNDSHAANEAEEPYQRNIWDAMTENADSIAGC